MLLLEHVPRVRDEGNNESCNNNKPVFLGRNREGDTHACASVASRVARYRAS